MISHFPVVFRISNELNVMQAFTSALFSAVHCTQGPPGTGKSYVGVCIVLAVDVMRHVVEKVCHSFLISPIVWYKLFLAV